MKWRDLIRRIEEDGWYWVRTKGSHQIYRHPDKQNTEVSPHSLVATFRRTEKCMGGLWRGRRIACEREALMDDS